MAIPLKIGRLLDAARDAGWCSETFDQQVTTNLSFLEARYGELPELFREFQSWVSDFANASESVWLFTSPDYLNRNAFRWDELEILCAEATGGDEEDLKNTKVFWDCHLPIGFSTISGYAAIVLRFDERKPSGVYLSCEPDFEEATEVERSYEAFLERLFPDIVIDPRFRHAFGES